MPPLRFQRLPSISPWAALATRVVSIAVALALGGVVFAALGYDVPSLANDAVSGSFGSMIGLEDLGLMTVPLIMTGLAAAVTLRIGLWNIGGEGQFYAGAIAASAVGLNMSGSTGAMLLLMAIAGAVGGAVWILIPALARAYLALDEILSTLLFNFIAVLLVNYLCTGPWRDPVGKVTSATARIPYEIPSLMEDLHWGIVAAGVLAILLALWFRFSRWGYEVQVVGANREAAVYAGMPVRRRLIQVMLLSGAIAGLAGMMEVAGTVHHLQEGISNNFGYFGIMIAVVASGAPLTVIVVAVFVAVILNAGIILQSYGMSSYEILALTGLILLCVAIGERLVYYRVFRPKPVTK